MAYVIVCATLLAVVWLVTRLIDNIARRGFEAEAAEAERNIEAKQAELEVRRLELEQRAARDRALYK